MAIVEEISGEKRGGEKTGGVDLVKLSRGDEPQLTTLDGERKSGSEKETDGPTRSWFRKKEK